MMSVGPPLSIDTSSINLETPTNDTEVLRMIQQYLQSKGYSDIAGQLQRQSNVQMEEACVQSFRQSVMEGDFQDIPRLVKELLTSEQWSAQNAGLSGQKKEFIKQE